MTIPGTVVGLGCRCKNIWRPPLREWFCGSQTVLNNMSSFLSRDKVRFMDIPNGMLLPFRSTKQLRFTLHQFSDQRQYQSGVPVIYYYRARYYDPTLGRFFSEDPITFSGGNNFYRYVNNSPVNGEIHLASGVQEVTMP
jgi:RHS repeat-associated protein